MTGRKEKGRWPEFADSKGIDAKYAEQQAEADRELKDATAGPEAVNPRGETVATGDTDLKNPNGSFAAPSPYAGIHVRRPVGVDGQSNRRPDGTVDVEGRQGGTPK